MNEKDIDSETKRLKEVKRVKLKLKKMEKLKEKVEPGLLDYLNKFFDRVWKKI